MVLFSEDQIHETKMRGRIEVICGSMFSGKTEELIRRLKRAKYAKQRVEIFKPAIDVRQRPMRCNGLIFPPPDPEHHGCCALLQPEKTGGAQFGLMAAAAVMPK